MKPPLPITLAWLVLWSLAVAVTFGSCGSRPEPPPLVLAGEEK